MGDKSKIEWTNATWNVVTGCTKVSSGCRFCYAERLFPRVYPGRKFADVRFHADRLDLPLRWKRPRHIFVNSMSDLFHYVVTTAELDLIFSVMAMSSQHTFQVLTKRPERMNTYLTGLIDRGGASYTDGVLKDMCSDRNWRYFAGQVNDRLLRQVSPWKWPIQNIWLGVSVEDQKTADERIPLLLQTPAAIRWVSYEPALAAVNLDEYLTGHEEAGTPFSGAPHVGGCVAWTPPVDWVVAGGESGPQARPSQLDWFRQMLTQCRAANVPFFMKQIGGWPNKRGDLSEVPADLRVREYPYG